MSQIVCAFFKLSSNFIVFWCPRWSTNATVADWLSQSWMRRRTGQRCCRSRRCLTRAVVLDVVKSLALYLIVATSVSLVVTMSARTAATTWLRIRHTSVWSVPGKSKSPVCPPTPTIPCLPSSCMRLFRKQGGLSVLPLENSLITSLLSQRKHFVCFFSLLDGIEDFVLFLLSFHFVLLIMAFWMSE